MNKLKRKGFTLIELLAVIVILAIIALIAVPVVMNIIAKANMSAFKDSAYGIIKAGELYYSEQQMSLNGMQEDKVFTFPNDIEGLEINGRKPTGGAMAINKKGQVALAITNGKYCVTKGYENNDIIINNDIINCRNSEIPILSQLVTTYSFKKVDDESISTAVAEEVVIPACITNKTKCVAGTPVAVVVAPGLIYKFYVLNDDTTKNEVTLIMDRNLYSETDENYGDVPWISKEDYALANSEEGDNTSCGYRACSDKGPLTALTVLKTRTSGWTNIPEREYIIVDDVNATSAYSIIRINSKARLLTNTEATSPDIHCKVTKESCSDYLYENLSETGDENAEGYWLSSAHSTVYLAWNIGYLGRLGGASVYNILGIRPVITLYK